MIEAYTRELRAALNRLGEEDRARDVERVLDGDTSLSEWVDARRTSTSGMHTRAHHWREGDTIDEQTLWHYVEALMDAIERHVQAKRYGGNRVMEPIEHLRRRVFGQA